MLSARRFEENTPERTRTSNRRFRRPMLYPIELRVPTATFVGRGISPSISSFVGRTRLGRHLTPAWGCPRLVGLASGSGFLHATLRVHFPHRSPSLLIAPSMNDNDNIKGTFSFVSLGCPKNLVDSERMLGMLAQDGYALRARRRRGRRRRRQHLRVHRAGPAGVARRHPRDARAEARGARSRAVVVAGCLAERQREMLLEEVPEVDQIVGVFGREEIAQVADRIMGGLHEQRTVFRPAPVQALDDTARLRITPRHFAYLKISEGCDRLCTFCAIPDMRGKHVTKPIEEVVARGPRAGRRRRPRADPRRPGHDLLRPRPLRPAPAGRAAPRAGPGRGPRLDSRPVRLPDLLHRRADRDAGDRDEDRARISTCRCSTSTTAC